MTDDIINFEAILTCLRFNYLLLQIKVIGWLWYIVDVCLVNVWHEALGQAQALLDALLYNSEKLRLFTDNTSSFSKSSKGLSVAHTITLRRMFPLKKSYDLGMEGLNNYIICIILILCSEETEALKNYNHIEIDICFSAKNDDTIVVMVRRIMVKRQMRLVLSMCDKFPLEMLEWVHWISSHPLEGEINKSIHPNIIMSALHPTSL